jgi:MFS family permease
MNVKKALENRIRGWLPKESNPPNKKVKAAEAPSRARKVLWYLVVIAILTLILAAVIIVYIPFLAESLVNRTAALAIYAAISVVFYLAYGRDYYKRHPTKHRVSLILVSGLLTAFGVGTALRVLTGPLTSYFWIPFILLCFIGGFIGDRIWRKFQGR